MAKSIRISDSLYKDAEMASQSVHRSLAQQIEHWAALGRAIESAGVTTAQVRSILDGDLRTRERAVMRLGLVNQESMYLFPPSLALRAKVKFPELEE